MRHRIRRIGVWNTAFLGDAVLTLPLLRCLRAAWPEADLDFYVRGGLAPLFEGQPEISRVFNHDKRGAARGLKGLYRQGREVAARGYDVWIDAHLSVRSSVVARMSGAPCRIGYAEAALASLVFTHKVERCFYQRQEVERLLALLEPLNLPKALNFVPQTCPEIQTDTHMKRDAQAGTAEYSLPDNNLCWPALQLPLSAHTEADALLASLPPGPILGVNPGSVWPTKRWLPEAFAAVMENALLAGANVVLLAAPDEVDTAAQVLACLAHKKMDEGEPANTSLPEKTPLHTGQQREERRRRGILLDCSGKTSLPVLAALISRMQCYLTNDSGPMHLAWGQGTPVVALFGPTVRALGFAPRGDSVIMEVDEACRPCGLHGHKACPQKHFRCMRRIDVADVWREVRARLYPWETGVFCQQHPVPGRSD